MDKNQEKDIAQLIALADSMLSKGNHQTAIDVFKKVLSLDPENPDATEGIGIALTQLNQNTQAKEYLTKAIEKDPNRWLSHYLLGLIALKENKPDIALKHFKDAENINDQNADLNHMLGITYSMIGDLESSINYLQKATELGSGQACMELAMLLYNTGNIKAAYQRYKQALKLKAKPQPLFFASVLKGIGKLKEALTVLKNHIKDNPNNFNALYMLIDTLKSAGLNEEADKLLKETYNKDPDDFRKTKFMGLFSLKSGNRKEALEYLQKAYELNNKDITVLEGLAILYLTSPNEEDKQKGLEIRKQLYETRPTIKRARDLAEAYAENKQFEEALNIYKNILKVNPYDILSYAGGCISALYLQQEEGAAPYLYMALRNSKDKENVANLFYRLLSRIRPLYVAENVVKIAIGLAKANKDEDSLTVLESLMKKLEELKDKDGGEQKHTDNTE